MLSCFNFYWLQLKSEFTNTKLALSGILITNEFLAALRRFIGLRGHPRGIYTDNATNCVRTRNGLKELFNFFNNTNKSIISTQAAQMGIKWQFLPPK